MEIPFELPEKGKVVPFSKIKKLCIHFGLIGLLDKIVNDPPEKPFKCDGCSGGWPDVWNDVNDKKVSLYAECLKHDLNYWAGYKGESMARFLADVDLMVDVAMKTKRIELAITMFLGVRAGGVSWIPLPFKWGFGRGK